MLFDATSDDDTEHGNIPERDATSDRALRMHRTRCAPQSYPHSYLARHISNTNHIETRIFESTPNGRRQRLRAPWLPLLYSLRCLFTKALLYMLRYSLPNPHYFICCVLHQNSTLCLHTIYMLRCLCAKALRRTDASGKSWHGRDIAASM